MKEFLKAGLWLIGGFLTVSTVNAFVDPSLTSTVDETTAIEIEEESSVYDLLEADTTSAEQTVVEEIEDPSNSSTGTTYTDTYAPNGTYTNVDGNEVPSPYYAPSAPSGATAECRDGTYSFSQHRSGTCSHHGGVADWL